MVKGSASELHCCTQKLALVPAATRWPDFSSSWTSRVLTSPLAPADNTHKLCVLHIAYRATQLHHLVCLDCMHTCFCNQ